MSSGIFLQAFRTKFIDNFIEDVANTQTSYYVAFGRNEPWDDEANPPVANTNIATSNYAVDRDMLFGKQVYGKDVAYMATNITWTANTIYDYYDDQDPDLYTKNYYVINSSNRVYKCLFNNYGVPSTVEPNDTNPNVDFNTYPDGYKWKYMFRVIRADYTKFATADYIPVETDPLVKTYAEDGAVHVIVVDNQGNNYPYGSGSIINRITPYVIQLANAGIDSISGVYQNSTFYVDAGSGNNFLTTITNYTVNTTGKFITTKDITPSLDATTRYKIGPQVYVEGDGTGLKAFAYVEPIANSIYDVQVISRGTNYSYANITFIANNIVLGAGGKAAAHSIISPIGGHGYDAPAELGCQTAGISIETSPLDGLPEWATYRQVSLIYNPISDAEQTVFLGDTFTQFTTLVTTANKSRFTVGGLVKGFTSGATAEVIESDQNHIYVKNVIGTFIPYETARDVTTGLTTIVSGINTGDLIPYTGSIFYYRNIEPVVRSTNSKEQVKLYFNF